MIPNLAISCCSFTATADIRANAEVIRQAVIDAGNQGSHIVLTPECALIGYPGEARPGLEEVDWRAVASLEDDLAEYALERGIILVLGTASPVASGLSNDALVCGAIEEERRYRKRCLTPFDETQFIPGANQLTFRCRGWRMGLTICYEVRFPALWGDLVRGGIDCFIHIAHMAGYDPDPGVKRQVLPMHYASRAAEWATPLVVCNTAADNRWMDSGYWDARGVLVASCGSGLLRANVDPRDAFHPFYKKIHDNALQSLDLRISHELLPT